MKDFEEMNTSETEYTVTYSEPDFEDEGAALEALENAVIF